MGERSGTFIEGLAPVALKESNVHCRVKRGASMPGKTAEGWLYVAVILDLLSRLVVGWAMGERNDEELVSRALAMALLRRDPPMEMLLHSDQGSPYTSHGYQGKLLERGIVVSMSRTGA
jgi:putative transposase